jgi:serine/threonine protein kinase
MREQAPSRGRLVGRYVVHDRIKLTLNAGQRVPVSFAAAIAAQALHGLHAAHEAHDRNGEPLGIIHRDVSPQNILVGIDGVSRVLDFGIAKAASRATATEDGQLKGKTAYMAPEQLQHGAVDRRTDIFAASIVLWELLCGRRLFFADSPAEMMSRVLTSPIENPQTYAPHVPPELAAITLRGLDRDPAGRFATAEEMALAIEDAVAIPRPKDIGACAARADRRGVFAQDAGRAADVRSGARQGHRGGGATPRERRDGHRRRRSHGRGDRSAGTFPTAASRRTAAWARFIR